MKKFSIILAVDNENGLGKNNDLAWKIPEDMKYFKDITSKTIDSKKKNAVIMGRKTWESIPESYRPLSGRFNCIISSKYSQNGEEVENNTIGFSDLSSCMKFLSKTKDIEDIFVIGGAQLYNSVLSDNCLEKAYITRVYDKFHCDRFFEGLPNSFELESRSELKNFNGLEYEFSIYRRKQKFIKKIISLFT